MWINVGSSAPQTYYSRRSWCFQWISFDMFNIKNIVNKITDRVRIADLAFEMIFIIIYVSHVLNWSDCRGKGVSFSVREGIPNRTHQAEVMGKIYWVSKQQRDSCAQNVWRHFHPQRNFKLTMCQLMMEVGGAGWIECINGALHLSWYLVPSPFKCALTTLHPYKWR